MAPSTRLCRMATPTPECKHKTTTTAHTKASAAPRSRGLRRLGRGAEHAPRALHAFSLAPPSGGALPLLDIQPDQLSPFFAPRTSLN